MFLSIDIGGTKTLLALFSRHGFCLKKLKFPTSLSSSEFVSVLISHLSTFIAPPSRSRILAITVAIPGTIHFKHAQPKFQFGNLNWPDFNLVTPLKSLFDCKIFFENDANLATIYETSRISHRFDKTIYLTFSTGIGGGIAKNGQLLKSSRAFEPGHVKYSFNNSHLEWEDIASAKTLSETYSSPLKSLNLNPAIKADLVSRLSLGLIDIIKSERPSAIIIGGPLALILNKFKPLLLETLSTSLNRPISSLPKFLRAHRPSESVIYGAYLYSKQHH